MRHLVCLFKQGVVGARGEFFPAKLRHRPPPAPESTRSLSCLVALRARFFHDNPKTARPASSSCAPTSLFFALQDLVLCTHTERLFDMMRTRFPRLTGVQDMARFSTIHSQESRARYESESHRPSRTALENRPWYMARQGRGRLLAASVRRQFSQAPSPTQKRPENKQNPPQTKPQGPSPQTNSRSLCDLCGSRSVRA